jgi:short-subunit dehydrogenase
LPTRLKPFRDQIIVITGASSGIGLTTARMAARKGAKLVLASRNEPSLRNLEQEINAKGGQALAVVVDVGIEADVRRVADAAVERFGGFDTWVNNAGVSVYGKLLEIPIADLRRLFETNFWGVVYGSLAALSILNRRGGAIINVGSTLSDRVIPYQGMYCASKHAVKAFTDALRMECEADKFPISVTLVKPAAIDTPYIEHARNYLPNEPKNPPPVYAPETVARAILHACENPVRDVFVGSAAKTFSVMEKIAPRLTDRVMEATMLKMQQANERASGRRADALFGPGVDGKERGNYRGYVSEHSFYTQASLHPFMATALLGIVGLAAATLIGTLTDQGRHLRRETIGV